MPDINHCGEVCAPIDRSDVMLGSVCLPMRPESVAFARQFVVGLARAWGVAEDVTDIAELLISEIATNSVVHPKWSPDAVIEVSVIQDGEGLIVECRDPSRELPKIVVSTDPLREKGRGLDLVRDLSYDHGVHLTEGAGKSVWFELLAWRLSE